MCMCISYVIEYCLVTSRYDDGEGCEANAGSIEDRN
jgi:hypothetical protein